MPKLKLLLLKFYLLSMFCGFSATAQKNEFQAKLSTGGYLGEYAAAVNFLPTQRWRLMLGYGQTEALGEKIHQFNAIGDYSWFRAKRINKHFAWTPITTGMGLVYSPNDEFFIQSPDRYPEKSYYQQTAVHALLLMGSQLRSKFNNVRVYAEYFIAVTDTYLIAQFNNEKWHSRYCCSSGISLIFPF